jgi:hypothetical protein
MRRPEERFGDDIGYKQNEKGRPLYGTERSISAQYIIQQENRKQQQYKIDQ